MKVVLDLPIYSKSTYFTFYRGQVMQAVVAFRQLAPYAGDLDRQLWAFDFPQLWN